MDTRTSISEVLSEIILRISARNSSDTASGVYF